MKGQYLLTPLFHPPVATRIYLVSGCLHFLPNSNRLVWFPQLPRSFVQVLQIQRHLPRAAAHSLPGTPVWPHSLTQAGLAACGSPFSQALQNLALLVHKTHTLSLVNQSWWVKPVFSTCCSKNVLGESSRVSYERGGRGGPISPTALSWRCTTGPGTDGQRKFYKGGSWLCFWEGAFHCPSERISPQRRGV